MIKLTDAEYELIMQYIYKHCGIDLSKKKFLVESKISTGCFIRHIDSFSEFWQRLSVSGEEGREMQQWLIDTLTTNYSFFNREADHFALMRTLIKNDQLPVHHTFFRIWCAGCAKGQEAYSLAMVFEDAFQSGLLEVPYSIVASDISQQAIKEALIGKYDMADYVRLPADWKAKYCYLLFKECEIKPFLRKKVEFRIENILAPVNLNNHRYDAIFCRNVMIYFDDQTCKKLLKIFYDRLVPGGYLFLGHTEIFDHISGFTYIEPAVYKKVGNGYDLQKN